VRAKLAKGPAAARAAFHAAFAYKLFLLRRGLPYWASGLGVDQLVFRRIRDALVRRPTHRAALQGRTRVEMVASCQLRRTS
jgi:long-subunit acyl-CoA synthetase (AMP-forming)